MRTPGPGICILSLAALGFQQQRTMPEDAAARITEQAADQFANR
jgi:hypothetical protein